MENMKQTLIIIMLALAIGAVSCRSKRMVPIEEPPVVVAPVEEPDPIPEPVVEAPVEIQVREERFTFEREEDKIQHDPNMYFVIVGSFRSNDNARRFTETLKEQGFSPVILLSETGFHRVSVNSYTNEASARARVMHIRTDFPAYHDTWLLIRKQN